MRLALLGPCDDDIAALARAAHSALIGLRADRVVYLGADDALDCVVEGWASLLDAVEPLELRVDELLGAPPAALDEAIEREKLRDRLLAFRSLSAPASRSIEMLHDRVVLLVDDKKELDEEDLLPASFIVFGRGDPTVRRVGSRVFLCPGTPAKRTEGLILLEEGDAQGAVVATLHSIDGAIAKREILEVTRGAKLKVQGA